MKRLTIKRMLKKRLSESISTLNCSYEFEHMSNVYGFDAYKEPQIRINMQNDIDQLQFLLTKLDEYNLNKEEEIKNEYQ